MITINGEEGEGGGQVLRTSLSLSSITGKGFRMINIRKARKKPGLMPQHLTGVKAMERIAQARVQGDAPGSMELTFEPGRPLAGQYLFDIGTAGSVTLLMQTMLPPLLFADGHSTLTLKGGTHVPFSPVYEYINDVFFPTIRLMGITAQSSIRKYGFYPRGGGQIEVEVSPVQSMRPFTFLQSEHPFRLSGVSGVANLPLTIAERQILSVQRCLESRRMKATIQTLDLPSPSPGTFLFVKAESKSHAAGFSSLGERGKRAETVGEETCLQVISHLKTGCCLDPHLSDQIVPYLALARGRSAFSTSRITKHLMTNLDIVGRFIDISWSVDGTEGGPGTVSIEPKGTGNV